jgi:hypothetical protein
LPCLHQTLSSLSCMRIYVLECQSTSTKRQPIVEKSRTEKSKRIRETVYTHTHTQPAQKSRIPIPRCLLALCSPTAICLLCAQHNQLLRHPALQPARSSSSSLDPAGNEEPHKKKIPHALTKLFPQAETRHSGCTQQHRTSKAAQPVCSCEPEGY